MPALIITAVDHTADLLTSAGHGLLTGDPAVIRNIGGALPTGYAAVTKYYAIRIDADTFKLASSSANALAGIPVNITSNGTGTQIVEYGIPYVQEHVYTPKSVDVAGSQVRSAHLNRMQTSLEALHRLLTGQAQTTWTHVPAVEKSVVYGAYAWSSQRPGLQGRIDNGGDEFWEGLDAASHMHCPISLPVGTTLTRVVFHYNRPTVGPGIFYGLTHSDLAGGGGGGNVFETDTTYDGALVANEVDLGDLEMLTGVQYHLRTVGSNTNTGWQFFGAELFFIPIPVF